MENLKQNRLDLMDNLLKLRETDRDELDTLKETCGTLMQAIKKANDEISLAKIKKELKDEISEFGKDECIAELKSTAAHIMDYKRMLDRLKPEERPLMVMGSRIRRKIKAKLSKNDTVREYDNFLTTLCEDMKKLIIKLDSVNSVKGYNFDLDFAEYFIDAVSRTFEKEKEFHDDVMAMNNLYKKIYNSIDLLEKTK